MIQKNHKAILEETSNLRTKATDLFAKLRDQLCNTLETYETQLTSNSKKFQKDSWSRTGGGGGISSLLRGIIFEKAGVHTSTVYGDLPPGVLEKSINSKLSNQFWASGISVIIHPKNPFIPSAHMNLRMIISEDHWFGGGADLTPMLTNKRTQEDSDTKLFHKYMREACNNHLNANFDEFKKNCDEYFIIKHRNENRGTGGIFFDNYKSPNSLDDLDFLESVGNNFIKAYCEIIEMNINKEWTDSDREQQLYYRGRYVEFNLMYDKGTIFGLKTGGNINSILSSLPPIVSW
ncbi:MAG: oxygen-dependent coproporphyrinogen oxidase [Hyphomicrobiales bacterium]